MSTDQLKIELQKIEKAIGVLESYKNRQVQDLPEETRKFIFSIKVIPDITAGGLEECLMVLTHLYWARYLVNREISERENPIKATSPSSAPAPTTPSMIQAKSPASPAPKISIPINAATNEINKKINTPETVPAATKPETKTDNDEKPLDFGPFMPK